MKKKIPVYCLLIILSLDSAGQSPGFFLNDWQPKTATIPAYNDVAKPGTVSSVTISFDTGTVINNVSRYLFGNNANPYMTQMVTEPVLINHITNLSPNIIRMPGGNLSSIYFWDATFGNHPADAPDSILDADGNTINAGYWYGKNADGWTLSLDNYYNMLQQTNNTGMITVNYSYARYGTGTDPVATAAHYAADWVRYDNGRTKFWEIGNENNGVWQAGYRIDVSKNQDGQPAIITGSLYGSHFRVFVDSMKNAAQEIGATIYIGAQLLEQEPASWQTATDKGWNQGVLTEAGNAADFYIVHSYYTPFNTNSTAAEVLNSATTVTPDIINYVKQSAQTHGAPLKPVALTEWNIFAVGSMQMVSHINGMHAVLVLGELIKNKYGMASRWNLANAWENGNDHGTFSNGNEPGIARWTPRPSFYHMYYFQKYFGDRMISSSVSGSSDIVAYASVFSSGEAGIVVVNKGTGPQTIKISSAGYFPGNRYYWYTLTGDTDNGEFSRKVLVNGNGPAGVAGGPAGYVTLKANSAVSNNDIRFTAPPRSSTFILLDKSNITGIVDIDPGDKLIKVFPNPTGNGNFSINFTGITLAGKTNVEILNVAGQVVYQVQKNTASQLTINRNLPKGVYYIKVTIQKGGTVKTLVVQ